MKKYLMNSLAIIGGISLIILMCSAIKSNDNVIGKYQVSSYQNGFLVIDTETGIVKTFTGGSIAHSYNHSTNTKDTIH